MARHRIRSANLEEADRYSLPMLGLAMASIMLQDFFRAHPECIDELTRLQPYAKSDEVRELVMRDTITFGPDGEIRGVGTGRFVRCLTFFSAEPQLLDEIGRVAVWDESGGEMGTLRISGRRASFRSDRRTLIVFDVPKPTAKESLWTRGSVSLLCSSETP